MKKQALCIVIQVILFISFLPSLFAQVSTTGTIMDGDFNEPLIGANIVVKGTIMGTTTDLDGKFALEKDLNLPFTIQISSVGFKTEEVAITENNQEVNLTLNTEAIMSGEVVVSASRVEEKILESPVSIEKMDIIAIRQSSTADYYDGISKLKGVHTNSSSLTFTSVNTRGFATIANTRFVQLMDGMDNASPLLNFPTGNIVGISGLDINNVELVPGASSALYGPNAFNGILLMNSKNPFSYPGLSVELKGGFMHSQAAGQIDPLGSASIRYAKSFNDKFAFKINLSYLTAKDWRANDYTTDRNLYALNDPNVDSQGNVGEPNFDGMNTYGDETQIFVPINNPAVSVPLSQGIAAAGGLPQSVAPDIQNFIETYLNPVDLRRTGFTEEVLEDNNNARSLKADIALHYRVGNNVELSANYRIGSGSSVYQGSERYALRNFSQQYFKLQAEGADWTVRSYLSQTDDGDSYNHTALGALLNETFSPTASEWVNTYLGTYAGALFLNFLNNGIEPTDPADIAAAHVSGRAAADAAIPEIGSTEFNQALESVRNGLFQRGGAGFIDNSRLYHTEAIYDLTPKLGNWFGLQIGGNFRRYDLFSDGTVFNEDPDGDGTFERIGINEFGVFAQATKRLLGDRLKLGGSIRYDKNQNFEGQFSPRVSAVFSAGANREHNFRTSFQTGFRNPSTQAQFIWFPTTTILLGTARENAERYGIHEGGAWTQASYNSYINSILTGAPDESLLEVINLDYIQPEKLSALEFGYKTLVKNKIFLDANFYYNTYKNFISVSNVVNINPVIHQGDTIATGNVFRPYTNSPAVINSWGSAIGINYILPAGFMLGGNYSYSDFSDDEENADFETGFNTPKHRFVLSLGNRNINRSNLGFDVSYRWQDDFFWESAFGPGPVKAYGSLDAQVNYKIKKLKTIVKLGASNIIGGDYQTNVGGPFIGKQVFISLNYDEFMR